MAMGSCSKPELSWTHFTGVGFENINGSWAGFCFMFWIRHKTWPIEYYIYIYFLLCYIYVIYVCKYMKKYVDEHVQIDNYNTIVS